MRPDPSLMSDLVFFRAVASSKSFIEASRILAVTQSAVSQRIKRLEERIGVALFRRLKTGLALTAQGELLFGVIDESFSEVDHVIQSLSNEGSSSEVVVRCIPSLALEWLAPRLSDFYRIRPDISVRVEAEINPDTRWSAASFDIAISYGHTYSGNSELLSQHPETVFPVASPELAERLQTEQTSLLSLFHDTTPWPDADGPKAEWDSWVELRGRPVENPTRDILMNLSQLCYRAAIEGSGIALGRRLIILRHLEQRNLVSLGHAPLVGHTHYFVSKNGGSNRKHVGIFANWVMARLAEDLTAEQTGADKLG